LPVLLVEPYSLDPPRETPQVLADATRTRPVILVIDDSPDVRNLLREALQLEGYQVVEAADGVEGLRLFESEQPDLVLLDIIMPEKDGIEALREILQRDPEARVITISGRDGAQVHNEAAEILGAVASFEKPFRAEDLLEAVRGAYGS
jgi:CheY-like chemotaxis protein